jgi:ParB-like chromosome segregation protein Spo0J
MFGWRQPIVVDTDRTIAVGHVRYEAALRLGLETVPVHIAGDRTPNQVRTY